MPTADLPQKVSLETRLDALKIDRAGFSAPSRGGSRIALRAAGVVALLGLLGAGAYEGVHFIESRRATEAPPAPVQNNAPVANGPTVELTATGYVVAERRAKLSAEVAARILEAPAREGRAVERDELLFELYDRRAADDLRIAKARSRAVGARVEVARARQRSLQQRLDREALLAASGAVPAAGAKDLAADVLVAVAEVRALEAEVAVARSEVEALETALDHYVVRAPFAGVVASRLAEEGDMASPETPLAELVESASLRVDVDVPEARLATVVEGGPCEVVFDAWPDKRFSGAVLGIGPRVARAKATAVVKVRLVQGPTGLREDMAARVSFIKSTPTDH